MTLHFIDDGPYYAPRLTPEQLKNLSLLNKMTKENPVPKLEEPPILIGGDYCHLCGAKKTQVRVDAYFVHQWCDEDRIETKEKSVYACGTKVWAYDGQVDRVVLGGGCIELDKSAVRCEACL